MQEASQDKRLYLAAAPIRQLDGLVDALFLDERQTARVPTGRLDEEAMWQDFARQNFNALSVDAAQIHYYSIRLGETGDEEHLNALIEAGADEYLNEYTHLSKKPFWEVNLISNLRTMIMGNRTMRRHEKKDASVYSYASCSANVTGRLTPSTISASKFMLSDCSEVSLSHNEFSYFMKRGGVNLDEVNLGAAKRISIKNILQKPNEFVGKTVRLSGVMAGAGFSDTPHNFFIVPNYLYVWLKTAAANAIYIPQGPVTEQIVNYLSELIGGRYTHIYKAEIVGTLSAPTKTPFVLELRQIQSAAFETHSGVYQFNL